MQNSPLSALYFPIHATCRIFLFFWLMPCVFSPNVDIHGILGGLSHRLFPKIFQAVSFFPISQFWLTQLDRSNKPVQAQNMLWIPLNKNRIKHSKKLSYKKWRSWFVFAMFFKRGKSHFFYPEHTSLIFKLIKILKLQDIFQLSILKFICFFYFFMWVKNIFIKINQSTRIFFYLDFLSQTFTNHRITAENSPLHIASSWTRTGNLWFLSASR